MDTLEVIDLYLRAPVLYSKVNRLFLVSDVSAGDGAVGEDPSGDYRVVMEGWRDEDGERGWQVAGSFMSGRRRRFIGS